MEQYLQQTDDFLAKFMLLLEAFTGDIVANSLTAIKSGNIAGWTFNEDGFHRSNSDETFSQSIDSNGISISDFFFTARRFYYK